MIIRSRTLTKICAAMLLTVFMAYYAIISAYAHVHVVNGVMVVHSHPFSDQHNHTSGQTLVLHHLTHFYSLEANPPLELEAPNVRIINTGRNACAVARVMPKHAAGIYLRAPPTSSFF